ncbi:MAG TPA: FAD-dependent oxidoreductase [Candidatus Entotheonella sp.]|jgi:NADPH-dependent 2,4-dienoyl-CoA reductase/sulfur reductase-like enzyme/nitrite reductase/ring-hydroxylating ferredoxin subunit
MAEHPLGQADTLLQEGQMQPFELEGKPVLLARVDGQYYASSGKCAHYGAPLHEGLLRGHAVMCPWHHACYDVRSGARLEPPALNDLAHYPVRIEDGVVLVTLPHDNAVAPQGKADPAIQQTFVIVGGGAAGNAAAEALRRGNFKGKIILVSAVSNVPVDRPNLSKDYLDGHAKPEWMPLRDEGWYAQRDIDLRLNMQVMRLDLAAHTLYLDQGEPLRYDKLLLATGATARHLRNTPGADLEGIYTLRTLADADAIIQAVQVGKRVVIVGASFIGMEVAAALAGGRGASVSVVAPDSVPFERTLGGDIGRMFQREHEAHGVQFYLDDSVTAFIGENDTVSGVRLKSGKMLEADFVVVGVGVVPATEFLRDSGLRLDEKDGSVRVNTHLQASHPDVYAAGDIARWGEGTGTRIEHWRVAQQHGVVAAHNMLGRGQDVRAHVPFFWTTQWHVRLNYVGHAAQWDEIIYRGTPEHKQFIAFYVSGGKLQAAAGCGYDQDLIALEFILQQNLPLSAEQMRSKSFSLVDYARS